MEDDRYFMANRDHVATTAYTFDCFQQRACFSCVHSFYENCPKAKKAKVVFQHQQQASLTNKIDEKAAIEELESVPMNLDVQLDEHLDPVQVADEEPFPARPRDNSQGARAAVLISEDRRRRRGFREQTNTSLSLFSPKT